MMRESTDARCLWKYFCSSKAAESTNVAALELSTKKLQKLGTQKNKMNWPLPSPLNTIAIDHQPNSITICFASQRRSA